MSGFAELGAQLAQPILGGVENWLGNVFGSNNSPPIVDIQNALLAGHYSNITSQSWAEAGLPDGGGPWLVNFLLQHGFTVNPLTGQRLTGPGAIVAPAPPAGVQHLIGPVGVYPLGGGNTRVGPTGTQPFAPYFGPQGTPYESPGAGGAQSSLMTPSPALGGLSPALAIGLAALVLFIAKRR